MLIELATSSLQTLSLQMAVSAAHAAPLMHAIAAKTTLTHLSLIVRRGPQEQMPPVAGPGAAADVSGFETLCRAFPMLSNLDSLHHIVHPRLPSEALTLCAPAWLQLHRLQSFTLDWPRGNRAAVELFAHVSNSLSALTALRVIGLDEHDPAFGHDEALLLFHTLRSSTLLPASLHSLSLHGLMFPQLADGSSACSAISNMHALRTLLITASHHESADSRELGMDMYTGPFRAWQLSSHLVGLKHLECLRLEIPGRAGIPIEQVRSWSS